MVAESEIEVAVGRGKGESLARWAFSLGMKRQEVSIRERKCSERIQWEIRPQLNMIAGKGLEQRWLRCNLMTGSCLVNSSFCCIHPVAPAFVFHCD